MKSDYDAIKKAAQEDQERKLAEAERAHEPSDAFQKRVWNSIQENRPREADNPGAVQLLLEFFRRRAWVSATAVATVLLFLFIARPWSDGALVLASTSEAVRGGTTPAPLFTGHLKMRLLLSENPRVILKTDKASYSAAIREVGTTPTERVFALAFSGQTPTGDAFQFADGQLILQLKQAVSGIPNAADVKSVRLMGVLSTSGRSSNNISRVFLLP